MSNGAITWSLETQLLCHTEQISFVVWLHWCLGLTDGNLLLSTKYFKCIWQHEAATVKLMWESFSFHHLPHTHLLPPQTFPPQSEACAWNAGLWSRCLLGSFCTSLTMFLHAPPHCTERISEYSRTLKRQKTNKNTGMHAHAEVGADGGPGSELFGSVHKSVVFEQCQQVVVAVVWEVWGAQVRQQLVRVGQLGKKLQGRQKQCEMLRISVH